MGGWMRLEDYPGSLAASPEGNKLSLTTPRQDSESKMTKKKQRGCSRATPAVSKTPTVSGAVRLDESSQPTSGTSLKRAAQEELSESPKKQPRKSPSEVIRSDGRSASYELLQNAPQKNDTTIQRKKARPGPSQIINTRGRTAWNDLLQHQAKHAINYHATRNSKLFSLPAELRNAIWEYVLIEPDAERGVTITPSLELPTLHSVSRLVRYETMSIWYRGQIFTHDIWNCNPDTMLAWTRHIIDVGHTDRNTWKCQYAILGKPNWDNLMRWCKTMIVSSTAIAISFHMNRRSWKECMDELEALRRSVGAYEKKWRA
ncbi:hypothetical protein LTR17_005443 [Elasticomyces elasticus]|nr:hypothetical protein LTR17_005443 [Elasticomyces elasticus]